MLVIVLVLVLVLVSFSSCSSELTPEVQPRAEVALHSAFTRAGESQAGDVKPLFILWQSEDYEALEAATATYPQPYYADTPDENISDYTDSPWPVGKYYPDNGGKLFATGVAPAIFTPEINEDKKEWGYLDLPDDKVGVTDIMVVSRSVSATMLDPFDNPDKSKTLVFDHALSRINFKAAKADGMLKYVRNVKVSIHHEHLAKRLVWNTYKIGIVTDPDMTRHYVPTKSDLNASANYGPGESATLQLEAYSTGTRAIGTAYILPDKSSLEVTITAEVSNYANFSAYDTRTTTTTIDFSTITWENGKPADFDDVLRAADSIDLVLVFETNDIELLARRVPWSEGGVIIVPISPAADS